MQESSLGHDQTVNYSHLFPTRYALELEGLKGVVGSETFKEVSQREDSKKQIKKLLEDRYTSGKNKWFFQALRVRFPSVLSVLVAFRCTNALVLQYSSDLSGFFHLSAVLLAKPLHVHHMSSHDACPHYTIMH